MSFVKKKRQLERQFLKKRTPLVIFREGIWVRLRIIAQTCHILLVIFSSIEDQRTLLITIKSGRNFQASMSTLYTLFENYSICRIWILAFWHFPPIFVLLKLKCLVTLFDRKLHFFKNSPKWTISWYFWLSFIHSKCKLSSLRSQCWMGLFLWFSNTV